MPDKSEGLIKEAYREWKAGLLKEHKAHPDAESLACFMESRLSAKESREVMEHLLGCVDCSRLLKLLQRLPEIQDKEVPQALLKAARGLVKYTREEAFFEIILRLKEEALDILSTTGDILVGSEFIPAAVLRSRKRRHLKNEVVILKDFKDIRVEAKIENRSGKGFNLTIAAKEKRSQKVIPGLRVTLLKDDLELESYLESGAETVFQDIPLGKYTLEISAAENKLASIILDIKS